ncbi:MAG: nitrogen regulation protein NR(I) [Gammaproteobacteria bacterium]|nr:nitrogen regulation protein NR(I) [Gammaproteobacteria bacterium]
MTQHILVVDDDASLRFVLDKAFAKAGFRVSLADSGEAALKVLRREAGIAAVLSDVRMPGLSGTDFLTQCRAEFPTLPVVIMTAHSDLDAAVAAYQGGAFEYLPKPFDLDEAVAVLERALAESRAGDAEPAPALQTQELIGSAPAMQEVFRAIGRLARSQATVLINGESGTGKERVAQALHRHSPRARGPFIALNMAAIPRELMESELFGHERGAFTGANERRLGRFEQARGGTLFLDEIGDMPLDTQTRLLRVLADGEFYRVGGTSPVQADVRIVAATHQDLEQLVSAGRFREDLFHRLNVIRLRLPRLAERPEDIPLLARHFLAKAAKDMGVEAKALSPEAEARLCAQDWPGNVRQLENTCARLTVMAGGSRIEPADLPAELDTAETEAGDDWERALARWAARALQAGAQGIYDQALPRFERLLLEAALAQTGGRKVEAAGLLGWGRNTLTRKLKELGVEE